MDYLLYNASHVRVRDVDEIFVGMDFLSITRFLWLPVQNVGRGVMSHLSPWRHVITVVTQPRMPIFSYVGTAVCFPQGLVFESARMWWYGYTFGLDDIEVFMEFSCVLC